MTITAIIVAAGRGHRAGGGVPKQYRPLKGRPVLTHTLAVFRTHPRVDHCLVVIHPDDTTLAKKAAGDTKLVHGGQTRAASVAAGLGNVPEGTTKVLIHDAARPCVPIDVVDRVIGSLDRSSAAAPGLKLSDALWDVEDGQIRAVRDRASVRRAQTPQGFDLMAIRAAYQSATGQEADDVEVALNHGINVAMVDGDARNIKITTPEDFERARRIMEAPLDVRTGTGFDVHRLIEGSGVTLCGVDLSHDRKLSGHSDADVAMHAITDAIFGALADGDIGQHFPPSDPQWKGAASSIFLKHAVNLASDRGFTISNLDCTIICETPKIGPHAQAMRASLAAITGLEEARISVKATTSERLGFTGRSEGIAAQASATLVRA